MVSKQQKFLSLLGELDDILLLRFNLKKLGTGQYPLKLF